MSGKIRVTLPGLDKKPKTGKGFFFNRLADCLKKHDVEIISDPKDSVDIALHNTRVRHNNARLNVVRIDGVYHNKKQNYKKMNKEVFNGFHKKPSGVIYQSNFSKGIADRYIGEFDGPSVIIPNGASPDFYKETIPMERVYEYTFITTSRWRPHKRLQDIIESFLMAGIEDSGLFVAGGLKSSGLTTQEEKKYFSLPNVIHLGKLDQGSLARYLVSSDVFIHLCWFDSCPNGVVEAICAGLPVITNNVGGTHEIVSESGGCVLPLDAVYDLKPCDLYFPPSINRGLISETLIEMSKSDMVVDCSYVDINNVAIKYLDFFKSLL